MSKLKQILADYRTTYNWRGIEKRLDLKPFTIKNWVSRNTVPPISIRYKIAMHLKSISNVIADFEVKFYSVNGLFFEGVPTTVAAESKEDALHFFQKEFYKNEITIEDVILVEGKKYPDDEIDDKGVNYFTTSNSLN
jgi:hypothetical protein